MSMRYATAMTGRKPFLSPDDTPEQAKGRPKKPAGLKGESLKEWKRVCTELQTLGFLSTADRTVITLYCKTWAKYVEADAKVDELGLMVQAPKTKVPMSNPYLAIANKAHEQLLRLSVEMGLTVMSRSRMKKTDKPKEEDPDEL